MGTQMGTILSKDRSVAGQAMNVRHHPMMLRIEGGHLSSSQATRSDADPVQMEPPEISLEEVWKGWVRCLVHPAQGVDGRHV